MPLPYTGQLAALGAASCWALTALAFEAAGRRIGSLPANLLRLPVAFLFLTAACWVTRGQPLPVDASRHAWIGLTLSGLVGYSFGDLCLYRAYVLIGPRLSSLMMSLAPVLAAVISWLALGETLSGRDLLGMALTLGGIVWAVLERRQSSEPSGPAGLPHHRPSPFGLALGFGGALGQAGGLVLSKWGMGSYHPMAANQIRVLAGFVGFAAIFTVLGMWPRVGAALRDVRAVGLASLGAFFGPFLGVSLSLVAIHATATGVAASIMATTPILIIPLVVVLRGERVGIGGLGGAVLAVAGVALLFL